MLLSMRLLLTIVKQIGCSKLAEFTMLEPKNQPKWTNRGISFRRRIKTVQVGRRSATQTQNAEWPTLFTWNNQSGRGRHEQISSFLLRLLNFPSSSIHPLSCHVKYKAMNTLKENTNFEGISGPSFKRTRSGHEIGNCRVRVLPPGPKLKEAKSATTKKF